MKSKSILDPTFKYVNAASTDIRKTFARIRREAKKPIPVKTTTPTNVKLFKTK